jgi:hypothetical protein
MTENVVGSQAITSAAYGDIHDGVLEAVAWADVDWYLSVSETPDAGDYAVVPAGLQVPLPVGAPSLAKAVSTSGTVSRVILRPTVS